MMDPNNDSKIIPFSLVEYKETKYDHHEEESVVNKKAESERLRRYISRRKHRSNIHQSRLFRI